MMIDEAAGSSNSPFTRCAATHMPSASLFTASSGVS
jgi:hypothetical protein